MNTIMYGMTKNIHSLIP